MILLVPMSPEVPSFHRPALWPGLIMMILMCVTYLEVHSTVQSDNAYVESLQSLIQGDKSGKVKLKPEAHSYLRLRPLLRIAPARGDWDIKRLLFANFIHGSPLHLFLNLVGIFAGARICATFLPFLVTLSIFILGGSLGLWASLLLSSELSTYIPHVGASGGIFALMGTYYVYNFHYRTKYFFWFPSRSGLIALRTSWFFFVDVILLEVVLSTPQFFPGRPDSVDHLAHVIGFASGAALALLLRAVQRWPQFLQTRGEFLYWLSLRRPKHFDTIQTSFLAWLQLLEINAYNDQVKKKLCVLITKHQERLSDDQLRAAFRFLSPTYIRLHTQYVSACVKQLVLKKRKIPERWLARTPYDSIIRIAKMMTYPPEEQWTLYQFIEEYRKTHPARGQLDGKVELLISKLRSLMPEAQWNEASDEKTDTSTGESTRSAKTKVLP